MTITIEQRVQKIEQARVVPRIEKLEADIIPRKEFENDLTTMKTLAKLFGEGVDTLIKRMDSVEKSLIQRIDTLDKKIDTVEKSLMGRMDVLDKKLGFLQWFITVGLSVGFGFVGIGVAAIGVLIAYGQGLF